MVAIYTPSYLQPQNVNGVPLAGAKLFFYQTGTTTLITIYSDSALGTPHANPVVADASGIFAPIYIGAETSFKTVLKTSADVTVQTVDPVFVTPQTPSVTVDNTVPRYNGTGGALQTSAVTIDDSNNMSAIANLTTTGTATFAGVMTAASESRIKGTGTNVGPSYLQFRDTAGTRLGFVGAGSGANATVSLLSDIGSIAITSATTVAITGNTTLTGTFTTTGNIYTEANLLIANNALIDPGADSATGFTVSGANDGETVIAATGVSPLKVKRLEDGTLVNLYSGTTSEGSIAVAAGTVSYNTFLGSHWSQLTDGSKPQILRGTVCESIDELNEWPGETNDRLPKFKVSDTPGSKSVYGVFLDWDHDDGQTNDAYVAAIGAGWVRIAAGVTVQNGDLLESNGNGCARVQLDDVFRASTVAKVTAALVIETYPDGSYLVPASLHCG